MPGWSKSHQPRSQALSSLSTLVVGTKGRREERAWEWGWVLTTGRKSGWLAERKWRCRLVLHQCACAVRLRDGLKWRQEISWSENVNQNKRKGRCFQVFSLIQFIIFFEVGVVSWTGKDLSASDGLKRYFCRMLNSCLPESLSLLSSSSASVSSSSHARYLKQPVNHGQYELIMNLFVLVCAVH